MKLTPLLLLPLLASALSAHTVSREVPYEIDGTEFQGTLIYDAHAGGEDEPLPGIVLFPNWMGPATEATLEKAEAIADDDFTVFVADMYGVDVRPANAREAGEAAGTVRGDRAMMRDRAQKAVDVFHGLADDHPIDEDRTIAIGFCFGGGTVLELARSGTESVRAVVSFHGDLASPTLADDADAVKIPQLVLHGADDPYVPQDDVRAWIAAMRDAEVEDWTLVQFGNTVHSFTDPTADSDGARYNERTADRAFEMLEDFAKDWLELDD